MKFTILWTALTVGNFLYQALTSGNWAAATERSFFQGVAIFAVWLTIVLRPEA